MFNRDTVEIAAKANGAPEPRMARKIGKSKIGTTSLCCDMTQGKVFYSGFTIDIKKGGTAHLSSFKLMQVP